MLNIIWISFFLTAFFAACYQSFVLGLPGVWSDLVASAFSSSKTAFSICLNLTGILCLWLGLLKIAETSGVTNLIAKALRPLFKRIMPEVPSNHPAISSMVMNMAANALGLDNAATPMGLKAMEQLQELNPSKDTASKAQILFMVLNASAVTLIPITILMYRAELGSSNPASVFIPILLATAVANFTGFLSVALIQRLKIFNWVVMAYVLGAGAIVFALVFYFTHLPVDKRLIASSELGNFILFFIVISFITSGLIKKINVYETFIKGAKEGFEIAIRIVPYLVAMLVAISVFRASGILDALVVYIGKFFALLGFDTGFVPALPTAIMKPFSGSGARAMMIETMKTHGADSFPGFVSSIIQGSTETTFYVLAVYFGAVKITKVKEALPCALLADLAGITAAIYFGYLFF